MQTGCATIEIKKVKLDEPPSLCCKALSIFAIWPVWQSQYIWQSPIQVLLSGLLEAYCAQNWPNFKFLSEQLNRGRDSSLDLGGGADNISLNLVSNIDRSGEQDNKYLQIFKRDLWEQNIFKITFVGTVLLLLL